MQKAREMLYWPGMVDDIRGLVEGCTPCNVRARAPGTEPLLPTPVADYPFQMLGVDLFHIEGKDFLLTTDYFSKWITVDQLPYVKSSSVTSLLEKISADFGIVECIRSDNGPQFSSSEFKSFVARYDIRRITSSPHYPKSNGQAERMMQTAKLLLK